jgi:HK97 family phage portal protein
MGALAERLERRALSYQSIWGGDLLGARINTASGVPVTQENAVQLSAVFACVRLLQDTISTLPVATFKRSGGVAKPYYPRPLWLDTPSLRDPSYTRIGHFAQVVVSLLLDGNSFTYLTYDDNAEVVETFVFDPRRVAITRNADSSPHYRVHLDDGSWADMDSTDILHIPLIRMPGALRGISPVEAARQSIGLGRVAEQYGAEFFANGASMAGIIEMPGEVDDTQAAQIAQKFDAKHAGPGRRHKTGVLSGGAKFTQLSVTPEQAQFLELRRYQLTDIARIYRIPPHLIQDVQPGSVSYASVEAQGIEYDTLTVRPYLEIIETAYSRILPPGVYLNFDEEGLLRGDMKSRYEAYTTGVSGGYLLRSDARQKEDMTPVDGLDAPLVPLNLSPAAILDQRQRAQIAEAMVLAGWDPDETLKLVGLPPVKYGGLPPKSLQQAQLLDPTDPTALFEGAGPPPTGPSPAPIVVPPPPAVAAGNGAARP